MVAEALPDDCFLVCKLHPAHGERDVCEAVLGDRLPHDAFVVVDDSQHTTPELLASCHAVVASERSMALIDTIVAGRPAAAIPFAEYPLGSGDMIHQAIVNILSNAITYTAPGGQITIETAVLDDVITVEISDTGRGIPAKDLPYTLERYS